MVFLLLNIQQNNQMKQVGAQIRCNCRDYALMQHGLLKGNRGGVDDKRCGGFDVLRLKAWAHTLLLNVESLSRCIIYCCSIKKFA